MGASPKVNCCNFILVRIREKITQTRRLYPRNECSSVTQWQIAFVYAKQRLRVRFCIILNTNRLKWAGHVGRMGDVKWQRCPEGSEEDRQCDGRTALKEIWKEWEEKRYELEMAIENTATEK